MRPRSEQPIPTLIIRDLADGPATKHDLAETIGVHPRNLLHYIRLLHADGKIRIADWEQRTGPALPVYALKKNGAGDVKRPARITKDYSK